MAGFFNDSTLREVMYADNVNFAGTGSQTSTVTADGQLLIGAGVAPNIRVGQLNAGNNIVIANAPGSITISVAGSVADTYNANSGSATPSLGVLIVLGNLTQGITTTGFGNTILISAISATTSQLGVAQLATTAQTTAGTSTTVVNTPASLAAKLGTQTAHGLPIGEGTTTAFTWTDAPTAGQLLIGTSSSTDPTLGTLTAGSGISITNGSGSITIASATGGIAWVDATSATQALAVSTGYVTDRSGGVAYTLPATAVLGDVIMIVGKLGAWTVAQNASQQILVGNQSSTAGTGGSIASTNVGDCVTLRCITAGSSTIWRAQSLVGNLTIT